MKKPTVSLYKMDDWRALYVNGDLFYQGHSIPEYIWEKVINIIGGYGTSMSMSGAPYFDDNESVLIRNASECGWIDK